jgi:hypothetical protein
MNLSTLGGLRTSRFATLAETVMSAIGYRCAVVIDPSKPDGTPRKLLDVTPVNSVGGQPRVYLKAIETMCEWFRRMSSTHTILPPWLCQPESVLRVSSNVGVNPSITVFYFN